VLRSNPARGRAKMRRKEFKEKRKADENKDEV
jgi:hypothetical protein